MTIEQSDMKRIRCYYKYIFNLYFALGISLFLLAFLPIIIDSNEALTIKLFWSISMLSLSFIMIYAYIYHRQTLICTADRLILRNPFGIMQTLDPKKCFVEIVTLPTEFSWVGISRKKWICIYEKNSDFERFKTGVSNSRKHSRVQVVYNENNESIINTFFDIDN